MLHENKEERGAFPESKTRHGVATSEAPPRLVQKLGGRFSLASPPREANCATVLPSKVADIALSI
jgi:hypothetical protein